VTIESKRYGETEFRIRSTSLRSLFMSFLAE